MILVDVLLFKDPDPGCRKVPDPLNTDPQHWAEHFNLLSYSFSDIKILPLKKIFPEDETLLNLV